MSGGWIRTVTIMVVMALTADAAFAAQRDRLTKTDPGSAVQVTTKTGEVFDAIWMGRDGNRAIFARLHPDETISISIESVERVRKLHGQSSSNSSGFTALGVATGFWGGLVLLAVIVARA